MSTLNGKSSCFESTQIHGGLRHRNGWCRLNSHFKDHRHSVGDAAKDTAAVVGQRADLAVFHGEIVVVFTADVQSGISSGAEFHAFDGGDAVKPLELIKILSEFL